MTNPHPAPESASCSICPPPTELKPATLRGGVSAREVYQTLRTDDAVHADVMAAFRKLGGNVDRWQPQDKRHMAQALTVAEDALEIGRGRRDTLTSALRSIRRRLESEVWP